MVPGEFFSCFFFLFWQQFFYSILSVNSSFTFLEISLDLQNFELQPKFVQSVTKFEYVSTLFSPSVIVMIATFVFYLLRYLIFLTLTRIASGVEFELSLDRRLGHVLNINKTVKITELHGNDHVT